MYLNYSLLSDSDSIRQEVYKKYESNLCIEKVVDICISISKSSKKIDEAFIAEVTASAQQRVKIKGGYFLETFLKCVLESTVNNEGDPRYLILSECKQRLIEQTGINLITLKEEKCNRDVDLLFRDLKTKKVYYLEIKNKNNHDSTKKNAIIRKFLDTKNSLKRTYPDLEGYIVFTTENKVLSYSELDSKYILSGNEFYRKFCNTKLQNIDDFLQKYEAEDYINQLHKKARGYTKMFIEKAVTIGPVNAANFVLTQHL